MLFVIMRDREILHKQLGLKKVYNSPDQVLNTSKGDYYQ